MLELCRSWERKVQHHRGLIKMDLVDLEGLGPKINFSKLMVRVAVSPLI